MSTVDREPTASGRSGSGVGTRVATGLFAGFGAVVLTFWVPATPAFAVWMVIHLWAAVEFVRMARRQLPTAPLRGLYLWIPLAGIGGFTLLQADRDLPALGVVLLGFGLVVLGAWSTLAARGAAVEALGSAAVIAFAVPYFAAPALCIYLLQQRDPFLVLLLFLIVGIGDSAAYFVGRAIGRRKLAPNVSPNKTWEGSIGGLLFAGGAAAVWAWLRLGRVPLELVVICAATAIAAQIGDLVESLFKRGAGVKDSSHVLPGHGGFYDRLDATLFAAPTLVACLWLVGFEIVLPG
ncbi:MAG: phosphatidate cytidylyltransferase [Acidobacteriota bacterium]